jgi:hypothetical protein
MPDTMRIGVGGSVGLQVTQLQWKILNVRGGGLPSPAELSQSPVPCLRGALSPKQKKQGWIESSDQCSSIY